MTEQPCEVLTPAQAATFLQISLSTVYRYFEQGRLPGAKVGSRVRFRREWLEKWLDEQARVEGAAVEEYAAAWGQQSEAGR